LIVKAAQLKALLSKVPDDAEVVIHDADSNYAMPRYEVRRLGDGTITLAAEHHFDDNWKRNIYECAYEVIE